MAEYVLNSNSASVNASTGTYTNTAGGTGTPGATDSVAIGPRGNSGTGITSASASSGATSITLSGTSINLVAGCIIKIAGTTGVYEVRAARSGNGTVSLSPALRGAVASSSAVTYYNGCDTFTLDNASSTWGDGTSGGGSAANGGGSVMFTCPTLTADRTKNVTFLTNGSLFVSANTTVAFGTEASPWVSAYTLTIGPYAASTQNLRYMQVGCSASGARYGSVAGKTFSMVGNTSRKRFTRIVTGITAGATSVLVADATSWAIGDTITLTDTNGSGADASGNTGVETKVITGITPGTGTQATISWTGGLAQAHSNQGYVVNETNTVIFTGNNTSTLAGLFIYPDANSSTQDIITLKRTSFLFGGNTATLESFMNAGVSFLPQGAASGTRNWKISESTFIEYSGGRGAGQLGGQLTPNLVEWSTFRGNGNVNAGFYIANGANNITINDTLFIRGSYSQASNGFGDGGCFWNRCIFTGCDTDQDLNSSYAGSSSTYTDCHFGTCRYYMGSGNCVKQSFIRCAFGVPHPTVGGGTGAAVTSDFNIVNPNTLPTFTFTDCLFANSAMTFTNRTNMSVTPSESFFRVVNREADSTKQDLTNRYGRIVRDNSTYRSGLSSIRFEPLIANTNHGEIYTIPGASAGVPLTIKGNLRFDATYGTATPPSVTLSGQGITPVTFTAPATADAWHSFILTATPVTNGDMTLTVAGQSTATTGLYWLDGVAFGPWVNTTRHYGCLFNNAVFCTADSDIAETDASVVGAYTGISINHGTQTLTVTSNHTLQEIHDYTMLDLTSAANLNVADWFTGSNGTYVCGYNLVIDGCVVTGTGGTITVTTGKTASMINSATLSNAQILSATSGDTGLLTISGLDSSTSLAIYNNSGTQVDYVASASSSYSLFLTIPNTGTWKYVIHKPGYEAQIGNFNANALTTVTAIYSQILNADGTVAYTASSSAFLAVSFTGTTQGNLDIGNGTVAPQVCFDEVEVALSTSNGLDWLASGKTRISQFNSAGGDYLFLSTGWRLRRASAGDVNATLNAFAVSADGTPVDGVNGSVAYLTSDSPTAIAAAVWSHIKGISVVNNTGLIPAAL